MNNEKYTAAEWRNAILETIYETRYIVLIGVGVPFFIIFGSDIVNFLF